MKVRKIKIVPLKYTISSIIRNKNIIIREDDYGCSNPSGIYKIIIK